MKKAIVPICVILFIAFTGCYLIIMEYAKQRAADRVANEAVSENVEQEALSEPDEGIQGILTGINTLDLFNIEERWRTYHMKNVRKL